MKQGCILCHQDALLTSWALKHRSLSVAILSLISSPSVTTRGSYRVQEVGRGTWRMISQRHLLFHWKRPRSPGLRSNFHWPRVFWCTHILWLPSNHRLSRWRHQALLSSYFSVGRLGWLAVLSSSPGQNQGVPWPSAGLQDLGKKSLPGSFMLLAIQLPVALVWDPYFLTGMGQGVLSASWSLSAFLLVPLQLQGHQFLILLNLSDFPFCHQP